MRETKWLKYFNSKKNSIILTSVKVDIFIFYWKDGQQFLIEFLLQGCQMYFIYNDPRKETKIRKNSDIKF